MAETGVARRDFIRLAAAGIAKTAISTDTMAAPSKSAARVTTQPIQPTSAADGAVLAVDDREVAALDRGDDDRGKARPRKGSGGNVSCFANNGTLIGRVDHEVRDLERLHAVPSTLLLEPPEGNAPPRCFVVGAVARDRQKKPAKHRTSTAIQMASTHG
jgi:hypothetical protein